MKAMWNFLTKIKHGLDRLFSKAPAVPSKKKQTKSERKKARQAKYRAPSPFQPWDQW